MPTVCSLFAGIGGIDLGFKQAGFDIIWANEYDTAACKTYRHNFDGSNLAEGDIRDISADDITEFDVLTAGFPCQPFSIAGKQKGFNDKRGNLFFEIARIMKPAHVRRFFEDEILSYTDAIKLVVSKLNINSANRNVLITHQFVAGALRSESEEISVGGSDNVDASVFKPFDYVALGHIHSPQNCGSEKIRYCGTPLKYSFSEANDNKSVTVAELSEKGKVSYRTVELIPRHDLVELKGTYEELTSKPFYENTTWQEDYTHITLTDEEDIPDAIGKLRTIYHRLMKLDYDNKRTRSNMEISGASDVESKSPMELFSDFYELQNNQPMNSEQCKFMRKLIENTWEDKQ